MDWENIINKEHSLGETSKACVGLRLIEGRPYIDARKWVKYPNKDCFLATGKGIMLEFADWRIVMRLIQEIIDSQKEEKKQTDE